MPQCVLHWDACFTFALWSIFTLKLALFFYILWSRQKVFWRKWAAFKFCQGVGVTWSFLPVISLHSQKDESGLVGFTGRTRLVSSGECLLSHSKLISCRQKLDVSFRRDRWGLKVTYFGGMKESWVWKKRSKTKNRYWLETASKIDCCFLKGGVIILKGQMSSRSRDSLKRWCKDMPN